MAVGHRPLGQVVIHLVECGPFSRMGHDPSLVT